jgi:hypothetical protein
MELEAQKLFDGVDPKLRSVLDDLVEVSNNFKRVLNVCDNQELQL